MSQPGQGCAAVDRKDRGEQEAGQPRRQTNSIVVGVDGSDCSRARTAILVAAREARYRDAPLIAVQAYSGERTLAGRAARADPALGTPADDERMRAESSLRVALRDALGDLADGVEERAVLGLAGRRIVEIAHMVNAQLIVLATRGSTSLLIGTVGQYVLRKAPCPVLVVPAGSPMALSAAP